MTLPTYITLHKTADRGAIESHPIYTGYEIEGWLFAAPEVGKPLTILRTKRNGISKIGEFATSLVTEILTQSSIADKEAPPHLTTRIGLSTRNSFYTLNLYSEPAYDADTLAKALEAEANELNN